MSLSSDLEAQYLQTHLPWMSLHRMEIQEMSRVVVLVLSLLLWSFGKPYTLPIPPGKLSDIIQDHVLYCIHVHIQKK